MLHTDIIHAHAWKDEKYRLSFGNAQRALLFAYSARLFKLVILSASLILFPLPHRAMAAFWLSSTKWTINPIPVCWEDANVVGNIDAEMMDWVRISVEATWAKAANIGFSGWGPCGPGSKGIRIRRADERPESLIGTTLDGAKGGMTLNLTTWNSNGWEGTPSVATAPTDGSWWPPDWCVYNSMDCIMKTAVHEFGHALGFVHEHLQKGSTCPPDIQEAISGIHGDQSLTPYDSNSIMNYCRKGTNWRLSASDIVGVQKVYGMKPSGSLVGRNGRCLDTPSTAWSTQTQMWDCHGGANQRWTYKNANGALNSQHVCLDVPGSDTANYTETQIWGCHGLANQNWKFQDVGIVGYGGKCLDRKGNKRDDGTVVQLYDCNGDSAGNPGAAQRWTFTPSRELKVGTKCLDIPGDVATLPNHVRAQIWACNGGPNQRFTLTSAGEIKIGGKCLDVEGPSAANGTAIQTYSCNGWLNQKFHFSGRIRSALSSKYGKCLESFGLIASNGTKTFIFDCGATYPKWDWYFTSTFTPILPFPPFPN